MTHTYSVSGMTCDGCKAKVTSLLQSVSGVKNVQIDLSAGTATVEMDRHIPDSEFVGALKDYPKYQLTGSHSPVVSEIVQEETKSWFETYKPLLTVFAYITLASLLTANQDGQFHAMHWMNNFMAGFFLVFSFFKMLDLNAFADSYAMYDVIAKRVKGYGYIYPFIELLLGLAYLMGFNPYFTNWATLIVMGISIVGPIQSVLDKKKIKCACLGAVFNLPMSTVTIVEDFVMIAMAAIALVPRFL